MTEELRPGDPSKLNIVGGDPTLGPDGNFHDNPSFAALGEEADILEFLRQMGLSEEAIAAFRNGEVIAVRVQQGVFGELIVEPGSDDWLTKMREEGRDHLLG